MKFNSTDDISMLACFTIMAGLLTLTCVFLIRDIGKSYTFSGSRTRNINHHNDDDDEPDGTNIDQMNDEHSNTSDDATSLGTEPAAINNERSSDVELIRLIEAHQIVIADRSSNSTNMSPWNILLLDARNKALGEYSSTTAMSFAGAIFYSKVVEDCQRHLRVRVAPLVACEVILTALVVSFYEIRNNEQGKFLLGGIERRLEKFQEPPPVKAIKPLAPPTDPGRKRHRKMKESLGMTQFCTETNQMTFGEIEKDADQDMIGFSTGLVGKSGSGKVRAAQKTVQRRNNPYGETTTVHNKRQICGIASSVTLTPLQGVKLLIQV